MARYTGPRVRISRRFGVPIFGPSKYLERRNYGPGVHGPKSRRKHTDYGLGLIEKQKLPYYYGFFGTPISRGLRTRSETPWDYWRTDVADSRNQARQYLLPSWLCQHSRRSPTVGLSWSCQGQWPQSEYPFLRP